MSTLDGNVTKALLIVKAASANVNFTQTIRYHLYDAGFIVVREEYRQVNLELAAKLRQVGGIDAPDVNDILGNVYLFVVARVNSAEELVQFARDNEALLGGQVLIAATKPQLSSRGVTLLFPKMVCDNIPSNAEAREYVQDELKGLLLTGMTELAKQKPKNPVEWLAKFLLENNPKSPPVTLKH